MAIQLAATNHQTWQGQRTEAGPQDEHNKQLGIALSWMKADQKLAELHLGRHCDRCNGRILGKGPDAAWCMSLLKSCHLKAFIKKIFDGSETSRACIVVSQLLLWVVMKARYECQHSPVPITATCVLSCLVVIVTESFSHNAWGPSTVQCR
jgi:hypothetical protein